MEKEANKEEYRHTTEAFTDYIFTVHIKDGKPIETIHGPNCITVTGFSPEEFTLDSNLWINMVYEQDRAVVLKQIALILSGEQVEPLEHRIIRKDGAIRWVRNTTVSRFDHQEHLLSYDGLIQDITERKNLEESKMSQTQRPSVIENQTLLKEALKHEQEKLSLLYEHNPDGVVVLGADYRITYANKKAQEIAGIPFTELKDKRCFEIIMERNKPCDNCKIREVIFSKKTGISLKHELTTSGKENWLQQVWYPLLDKDGNVESVVEIVKDISETKQAEEKLDLLNKELIKTNKRLKRLVLQDPQTGLYNYRYLQEVIEIEFYRAKRCAHPLSVMMLDIDYFNSINNVYGHQFGDLVLKQLARQLKGLVRQYDIVIRSGGEEFMIISPGINRTQALTLAQRLLDAINLHSYGNKKQKVKLKLSIAVATYPEDKIIKGMDLVEITDRILSQVKEYGGNNVYSSVDIKKKHPHLLKKAKVSMDVGSLREKIKKLTKRTNQSLIEAVFAFAKTIELKDHYTGEHVERTVLYATKIARVLNLSEEEIERIKQAAMLHDLGKIGISETILIKKFKLTKEEFEEIKKHPQIGAEIIRPIKFLHNIVPLILYHHERWDGKGYPNGLKGEQIPIGARIVAIADVYQALSSNRPYRKAYPKAEALKIIKKGSGTQFDPKVVTKFVQIMQQRK